MTLIVDANRTGDFSKPLKGHAVEILKRIRKRSIILVSGGKLHKELVKTPFRRIILECQRTGILLKVIDSVVNAETDIVESDLALASDDAHVLALLRVSCADIIYTEDAALIVDAKNKEIRGRML